MKSSAWASRMTDSGRMAGPAAKLNNRPVEALEEETERGVVTAVHEIRRRERLEGLEKRREEGMEREEDLREEDWWKRREFGEEAVDVAIDCGGGMVGVSQRGERW